MNVIHPSFLWALLFLAIPIIVHLFNLRRYKTTYFSNTSILKTILNETQKTSQLKKRLLLACRILAFLFIILAFAQPFWNGNGDGNTMGLPIYSIYIDNSFSMEAPSHHLKAIDEAKQKAREIVQSAPNASLFQIVTNDMKGNQLQLVSSQEALAIIQNISESSRNRTVDEIWNKQLKTTASNSSTQKIFYWMSDLQRNQIKPILSSEYPLHVIPIVHERLANVYIDTAYIHSPVMKLNQDVKIIYSVRKSEDDPSEKSLITLTQNDKVKLRKEIEWKGRNNVVDTFIFKIVSPDWQYLKLSISDPHISFDNDYFFTFYIPKKPFVTLIGAQTDQKFLIHALKADDNYDVHSFSNENIPAEELKETSLIILNQLNVIPITAALTWLKSNKNIAILPPSVSSLTSFNEGMDAVGVQSFQQLNSQSVRIKSFNLQDVLLRDIFAQIDKMSDFPSFQSYYVLGGFPKRAKEVLISFDNAMPFLCKYRRAGEGNIYVFTASFHPSQSDFVYSAVFAPLMYKLGAVSSSYQTNAYFISSKAMISIPVESSSQENIYQITNDKIAMIPPQRKVGNTLTCSLDESIDESGFYSIVDPQKIKKYQLALNYMRNESQMDFVPTSDLSEMLQYKNLHIDRGNLPSYLSAMASISGLHLWKLWVVLAVLFVLLELIILAFWDKYAGK